jgi:hypothetical protein
MRAVKESGGVLFIQRIADFEKAELSAKPVVATGNLSRRVKGGASVIRIGSVKDTKLYLKQYWSP